jgi:hypothetical protein
MGLIEVIIAVGLFVTLAAGVVHLFAMSASALAGARRRTTALIMAVDKLEQLRASVQARGIGMGTPETRTEQTEYLGVHGHLLEDGRTALPGRAFARVWSIGPLPGLDGVLVARVTVVPIGSGVGGGGVEPAAAPHGARLVTLLLARP